MTKKLGPHSRFALTALPIALGVLAVAVFSQESIAETGSEPILLAPPSQQIFDVTPEGVAFAPLIGDRFAEPYMAVVKLPAGLVSPAHTKSATMYGVMISGEMTHVSVGAGLDAEVVLPAGSFYQIPAGVPHVSKCVSDVECVTFLYQDGKFDFVPVTE